jgi:hypothetical protein
MSKYFWLVFLLFFCVHFTQAQKDTVIVKQPTQKSLLSKSILPLTLIVGGTLYSGTQSEKNVQADVRNRVGNTYHNGADDYIQYIPFAQVYIGDVIGFEAKNHWFDQTKNMVISSVGTGIIVHSFKRLIGKERPDGSSNHSFPSGHTSNTFVGATVLYHEFKESTPVYAYSGFLISSATGGLRVMNNRHWVSDVVVGAGVAILVTNLVYHFEPLKNWNPFKNSNNVSFYPDYNGEQFTFTAGYKF